MQNENDGLAFLKQVLTHLKYLGNFTLCQTNQTGGDMEWGAGGVQTYFVALVTLLTNAQLRISENLILFYLQSLGKWQKRNFGLATSDSL